MKTGVEKNTAGRIAALRGDSKNEQPGLVTVHETLHLLGLQDTYIQNSKGIPTGKIYPGFNGDIMAESNATEINQYHWDSWGNYVLDQVQAQQQQNQSPSQFILKYQVETGKPTAKKKK